MNSFFYLMKVVSTDHNQPNKSEEPDYLVFKQRISFYFINKKKL